MKRDFVFSPTKAGITVIMWWKNVKKNLKVLGYGG